MIELGAHETADVLADVAPCVSDDADGRGPHDRPLRRALHSTGQSPRSTRSPELTALDTARSGEPRANAAGPRQLGVPVSSFETSERTVTMWFRLPVCSLATTVTV